MGTDCASSAKLALWSTIASLAMFAAPTAFGQAIVVKPRINTPVVNPATVPATCAPGVPTDGKPCSPTSVPPLSPMLPPIVTPVTPTVTVAPRTGLTPSSPRGGGAAVGQDKVLSYFQRGVTQIDTRRAFGFVLMPKSAVTDEDDQVQTRFCQLMLASLEFVAPDAAARRDALATYWPLVATREADEIEAAFAARDCERLLAWYDHNLARSVASRAGVAGLSGPLLITWPSAAASRVEDRDPLIVDFAKADQARAAKALAYWFKELTHKPELWTSRIREGTIRAELADAINDTAGVVVAMLSGKWESVTAVNDTP